MYDMDNSVVLFIPFSLWCMSVNILWHWAFQCHSTQWVHGHVWDIDIWNCFHGLIESEEAETYRIPSRHSQHQLSTLGPANTVPWCRKVRTHCSSSYQFLFVSSSIIPCSVYKFVLLSLLQGMADLPRKGMQPVKRRGFLWLSLFLNSIALGKLYC